MEGGGIDERWCTSPTERRMEMTDVEYAKWFKEQWEAAILRLEGYDLSKIYIVADYTKRHP